MTSSTGATVVSGSIPLDATSRVEIAPPSPDSYGAHAFSAGYAPRVFTADFSGPALEAARTAGGRMEVRTKGRAIGWIVDASDALYISSLWRKDAVVNVTAPGTTSQNFAAGSYVLAVQISSGDRSHPFTVTEATTTHLK